MTPSRFGIALVILITFTTIGCYQTYNIKCKTVLQVASQNKIDRPAVLVLDPKVCTYSFIERSGMYIQTFNVGEALCDGIKNLANSVFLQVVSESSRGSSSAPQLFLMPELETVNVMVPFWLPQDGETLIRIKYTIKNFKGDTLWLGTSEGRVKKSFSSGFTMGTKIQESLQEAVEEQFRNAAEMLLKGEWWTHIPQRTN